MWGSVTKATQESSLLLITWKDILAMHPTEMSLHPGNLFWSWERIRASCTQRGWVKVQPMVAEKPPVSALLSMPSWTPSQQLPCGWAINCLQPRQAFRSIKSQLTSNCNQGRDPKWEITHLRENRRRRKVWHGQVRGYCLTSPQTAIANSEQNIKKQNKTKTQLFEGTGEKPDTGRSWRGFSLLRNGRHWEFPGGPVVGTVPSTTGGTGSIPGWGAKILQAEQHGQK